MCFWNVSSFECTTGLAGIGAGILDAAVGEFLLADVIGKGIEVVCDVGGSRVVVGAGAHVFKIHLEVRG